MKNNTLKAMGIAIGAALSLMYATGIEVQAEESTDTIPEIEEDKSVIATDAEVVGTPEVEYKENEDGSTTTTTTTEYDDGSQKIEVVDQFVSDPNQYTDIMEITPDSDDDDDDIAQLEQDGYVHIKTETTTEIGPETEEKVVDKEARTETIEHPEESHEEQVIDTPAYTETIEHEAITHEEQVIDTPAYTETIEHPAITHEEQVIDTPAYTETIEHPAITHEEKEADQVITVVDKEAWTETREHPATYKTITVVDKEAWTQTIEHPATYKTITVVDKEAGIEQEIIQEAKSYEDHGLTKEEKDELVKKLQDEYAKKKYVTSGKEGYTEWGAWSTIKPENYNELKRLGLIEERQIKLDSGINIEVFIQVGEETESFNLGHFGIITKNLEVKSDL